MTVGARLFKAYVAIFIVFWLSLAVFGTLGGIGSVELLLFGAVAIGAGAYCTWRIARTRTSG